MNDWPNERLAKRTTAEICLSGAKAGMLQSIQSHPAKIVMEFLEADGSIL